MKPLIAVTAASGKTGAATVRELLARGERVRALVRTRDARAETLARAGAEVVQADMFDAEGMADALYGVQRAYFCPPMHAQTGATLAAFMYAAGVNRLEAVAAMTQWLASARHPAHMTREMWNIEQLLPLLKDTAVTILNPGWFADNYLRIGVEMASQLGLYANFVGQSRNAPPSNDDMGRVAAAILADPSGHEGKRYRITGPEMIGVDEITAALSRVFGRHVRAIDAPAWLLNKVAAFRSEIRYDVAAIQHYIVDHRQGAFEFGGATHVVHEITGRPAERFETTIRSYASRPEAQRTAGNFVKALREFLLAPLWRGYDNAAFEREHGFPALRETRYAMDNDAWKADRAAQLADTKIRNLTDRVA